MKLFEIANEYEEILDHTFDPDTGEINAHAVESLDLIKAEMNDKAIAVASYIRNIDAEREAITQAKKNMAERESRLDKRADYLTQYLQSNMERCGITEIKSPHFVIKLKKCPFSTDITDENIIPEDYKRRKEVVTIDRVKLKEEMLAGVVIPGAGLKQNNRLEIR